MLDIRTIVISYALSYAICTIVVTLLWLDHRKRFLGLGLWLAGFVLQFVGILLIGLCGILPDSMSIVVGNTLIVAGILIFYMGLIQIYVLLKMLLPSFCYQQVRF